MRFDEEFAKRLQSVRSEKGLSQQDLSRLSGVAQAQLSRYEAGTNKPRPHVLSKLAKVLGVSATWLSTGEIPFTSDDDRTAITIMAPSGLVESLTDEAIANDRTFGEEVISRLEASFAEMSPLERRISNLESSLVFEKFSLAQQRFTSLSFAEALEQLIKAFDGATIPNDHPFKQQIAEMKEMVNSKKPDQKKVLKDLIEAGTKMLSVIEGHQQDDEEESSTSDKGSDLKSDPSQKAKP